MSAAGMVVSARVSPGSKKRKIGDSVLEVLESARNELEERERQLDEREGALRKAVEGVEREKQLMAGRRPNDVLRLNIGGVLCQVLRRTLCQYENSMLAAHFSGRWDESIEKDSAGNFFIDQPSDLMLPLVDYLRAKAIELPTAPNPVPPPSFEDNAASSNGMDKNARFLQLVEYYGMTPFVYQRRFQLHRGMTSDSEITHGAEPSIKCAKFSSFTLHSASSAGGAREVERFEITIESAERLQVGWASIRGSGSWQRNVCALDDAGFVNNNCSTGLDFNQCGLFLNGKKKESDVQGLTMQAGTVVVCERQIVASGSQKCSWLVDGRQVATCVAGQNAVPAISGKGQWSLTGFSYA